MGWRVGGVRIERENALSGVEALTSAVALDPPLNAAESLVVEAFYNGTTARLDADAWIRASLLRGLCVHSGLVPGGTPAGLRLVGPKPIKDKPPPAPPRVAGELNLRGLQFDFPLVLKRLLLEHVQLADVRVVVLDLGGSVCAGFGGGRLHASHAVNLNDGFVSNGRVWLVDAEIGGDLNLDRAALLGQAGKRSALVLDGTRIGGRLYMRSGFCAEKEVSARSVRVEGSVYLDGGVFKGALSFAGARVGGDLSLSDATLDGSRYEQQAARHEGNERLHGLDLHRLRVEGGLEMLRVKLSPCKGKLTANLAQAHLGYLNDKVNSWHGAEKLMDGFTFDGIRISDENVNSVIWPVIRCLAESDSSWVGQRRKWLAEQPPKSWSAHPYDQVIAALRASGQEAAARSIAVARERQRRKAGRLRVGWPLNWLFGAVLGHGYRPAFAVLWSAAIIGVGSLWFGSASEKATKKPAPDFDAFGYSLDAFLPFDLGQVSAYVMTERADNFALWTMTVLGWLFAALIAGAVTGLLRKN